jgi:hypothetical protein
MGKMPKVPKTSQVFLQQMVEPGDSTISNGMVHCTVSEGESVECGHF